MALMAQLQQAQQADAAPLEKRKLELEAELAEVTQQIQALKPSNDSLAVYRAVRKAVKQGKKTLAAIVDASGHDQAKVEAMLNKHLKAEEGKTAIFTLKNGEYILTPKPKK